MLRWPAVSSTLPSRKVRPSRWAACSVISKGAPRAPPQGLPPQRRRLPHQPRRSLLRRRRLRPHQPLRRSLPRLLLPAATSQRPARVAAGPNIAASSLSTRMLVEETGIAASAIQPTGKDGRATKADVLAALSSIPSVSAPAAKPAAPAGPRLRADREERVRMTRLRRTIANRLKEAQNTAAMLTTFNEVDMTAVMTLRDRLKEDFEKKHGARLGFMSFFVKACIAALKELPSVNAEIEGEDLVYKNYYDIGVAVGTPQGLTVPVIRDADAMNFADIEKSITDLGRKARDGKLAIADLMGGTFTISNGGVYGSLMSTPILNPPQSANLGMHKNH